MPAAAGGAGVRLPGTVITLAALAGGAGAGDDAWARYRVAAAEAEAGRHAVALPLFRATVAEASEPDLRQAACFGLGVSARALVEAGAEAPVACEGAQAFTCFLAREAAPEARAVAEAGQAWLGGRCVAPPPAAPATTPPAAPPTTPTAAPEHAVPWLAGGGGLLALATGGALVGLAFDDAATVRARGRRGTADLEGQATAELTAGYVLLGAGAGLLALAAWQWWGGDPPPAATIYPAGLGLGGRF